LKITPPRIPSDLKPIDSFAAYAREFLAEDATVTGIRCGGETCEGVDFYKLDLRGSVFERCVFRDCNFEKAGFIDVEFRSCDVSNSRFQGAFFERCRFVSCKCVGVDMVGAMLKTTAFADTNLRYANWNTAHLNGVAFDHVDFSDAALSGATLKRFCAEDSKFIRNDFTKTMLNGVDFSRNEFVSPIVSAPPAELQGITVDMFQAAGLMHLWGIRVK